MYLFILDTSGFVAFVVGGFGHKEVELYSPDGTCQHSLAPFPVSGSEYFEPVLAFMDEKILACGGRQNKNCFLYHSNNDTWADYSNSTCYHDEQPGEIFNGKLYIVDDSNPEVFDPVSYSWSSWPTPLNKTELGPCLVAWKDTFILLGGYYDRRQIQTFNHSSNTWQVLDLSSVPIEIYLSGCILLPNNEILVVGSDYTAFESSATLYNIEANTWNKLPDISVNRHGTSLVLLGTRVFAIASDDTNVIEEFHYNNNTWSSVEAKLIVSRFHHGTIALPAELFQHLPGGCVGVQ